jgi:hypothetical protein
MQMNSLEVEKQMKLHPEVAQWIDKGIALTQAASDHQWAVADWMLWGEDHIQIKQAYDIAERATGYKRKTLQEWAYVARHVSIRMENLTFGHHQVVAALLPDAQKYCLEYAVTNNLPIGDLREMARWQPRPLKIDTENGREGASLLLRFGNLREMDTLEIAARQHGFICDERNSAVGRFVRHLIDEFLKANPELSKASVNEYTKQEDAAQTAKYNSCSR